MKLTFVQFFFPFFFFLKNIYYILQKTTARNSFVSIYLFRVSRSISSILSSVFCFTIQSSTSLSSSRLPKLSQCCSMYYHPFHMRCVNRKKKKSFVKKKKKEKKTNRFLDSIYFKDLEWLFWRFLDAQENLPSHKSCSTIDARDIRRKCSWINHKSLHLRKKFFLKF